MFLIFLQPGEACRAGPALFQTALHFSHSYWCCSFVTSRRGTSGEHLTGATALEGSRLRQTGNSSAHVDEGRANCWFRGGSVLTSAEMNLLPSGAAQTKMRKCETASPSQRRSKKVLEQTAKLQCSGHS